MLRISLTGALLGVAALCVFAPGGVEAQKSSKAMGLKRKADAAVRAGRLHRAVTLYREAGVADPSLAVVNNELGTVYFALKRYPEAIREYQRALSKREPYPTARYNLAYALRRARRYREARDAYQRFLREKPTDPDGHYGLAEALRALGDRAGAARAYAAYVRLERRPTEAKWVARARARIRTLAAASARRAAPTPEGAAPARATASAAPDSAPAATPALPPAARVKPTTTAARLARSVLPPAQRLNPAAAAPSATAPPSARVAPAGPPPARRIEPPLKASPATPASVATATAGPPATLPTGLVAKVAASTPTARPAPAPTRANENAAPAPQKTTSAALSVSVSLDGAGARGPGALLRRGEAAFTLRRYAEARRLLEAAAKAAPGRPEVHYKLAATRAAAGDLRGAIGAWETVTRLDPANRGARDLALRARERLGLIRPIRSVSGDPVLIGGRALKAGRAAQALVAFERALRGAAPSGAALLGRARALMALARYREAAAGLTALVALRPTAAPAHFLLARCFQRLGAGHRAATYYRLYLSLASAGSSPGRTNLARRWLARYRQQ